MNYIFKTFMFLSFLIYSFSDNYSQPIVISGGSENDIIGRITRLPDDKLLAIIERNPDWGSGDLYSSFSTDNGDTWGELLPVVVKTGNQSTHCVVVTQDDSIRVYYASDETGYYKIYTLSSFDGATWNESQQLDLGWETYQSIYDPAVFLEEDGSMTMTYVKLGGGGYVTHCTEINQWDKNKTLIQSGAYRIRICKSTNGTYLSAYHRNIGGNQYDVHIRTSTDLITWTPEVQITNNGNSHDPYCNITQDGFMVYYAKYKNPAYNLHRRSSVDGIYWQPEEQITNDQTNNTQPAFFNEDDVIYLVWTHAIDYNTNNDIYFEKSFITGTNDLINLQNTFAIKIVDKDHLIIKPKFKLQGQIHIEVFDLNGKLILHQYKLDVQNEYRLSVGNMRKGIYLFRIIANDQMLTKKFLVK